MMIRLVGCIGVVLVAGCDRNQFDPLDTKNSAPVAGHVLFSPDSVYVDNMIPSNGEYSVTLTVRASVGDDDGLSDLAAVTVDVLRANGSVAAAGAAMRDDGFAPDSVGGDGVFAGSAQFSLTRAQTGSYQVRVTAVDRHGARSNSASGILQLTRHNSAPSLTAFPSVRQFPSPYPDSMLLFVSIAAADSDGIDDISTVLVRALNAVDSTEHTLYDDGLAQHNDPFPGDGVFSGTLWLQPLAGLQNVELVLTASDHQGAFSNTVRKTLQNSPPHILQAIVPDSVRRPTSGFRSVSFFVTAADSDGIGDIDSVYFINVNRPTERILMYDDGNLATHGDSLAHDGTYSLKVEIGSSNQLGTNEFRFYVIDRAGARDSVLRRLTVYE